VLFDGFGDVPGALEAIRENDKVAGAETYRICAIRYRYLAFEQKTGFLFSVSPVEGAWLARPDGPSFAGCCFCVCGLFDDYIFYSRHLVSFHFYFFVTKALRHKEKIKKQNGCQSDIIIPARSYF
jgi:hypothetical protein